MLLWSDRRRDWARAGLLAAALLAAEAVFLELPYKPMAWAALQRHYLEVLKSGLLSLGAMACVVLFLVIGFRASRAWQVVLWAAFTIALFYEYSYQKAFGRFSMTEDLYIAFYVTNAEHKLDAVARYFNIAAVVPSALFGWLLLRSRAPVRLPLAVHVVALSLVTVVWSFAAWSGSRVFPLPSVANALRTGTSFALARAFSYESPRDQPPTMERRGVLRNVVFIVDEGVRPDHLSLNGYERPTTPFLDRLASTRALTTWGTAVSGSTCSHASAVLLFTGLQVDALPARAGALRRRPSIFQFAKAAGYRTHFVDGQMTTFWIGSPFDLADVDSWVHAGRFSGRPPWEVDIAIARHVRKVVSESTGNFIWVWKRGLHYPYYKTFPPEEAPWRPFWAGWKISLAHRAQLVNAYDNGIRWSVDHFFRELLQPAGSTGSDTSILYTSDHGQTLGDGGLLYTHCGESRWEAMVPLVLIGGPQRGAVAEAVTHGRIFATLLDLLDIRVPGGDYEPSLLDTEVPPASARRYFGHDLHAGTALLFDEPGSIRMTTTAK